MTCYFVCAREDMRVCCDDCGAAKHVFRRAAPHHQGTRSRSDEAPRWYREGRSPWGWVRWGTKDYCMACRWTVGSVSERVKRIIAWQLGCDSAMVVDEATLESLGADSLAVVEIVICLEDVFECDIPDDDTRGLHTVKDCIDVALRHSGRPA